ncbi:MAG: T9SS type A sorting domain-containing protein [Bacteroidales bacterium]|nr:T9SS type A sorting domain-containing protein [Bacteroidales bacterium]
MDFDFNIYPNPNDGNFTIVLDTEDVHPFHVEIFNSSGISVFASEYCDTDQAYINCTNLQQGVYYVKVLMGNNVLSKRTVIRYD